MRKFGLVFGGFLLGVIVMIPFVPEISMLRQTIDSPSRVPGAQTSSTPTEVALDRAIAMYTVTHVVDGDTIDVRDDAGAVERVRLVGIDTPETVDPRANVECYGPEASAHLKELIEGQKVALEAKPDEDKDTYGRLLRYVYLDDRDIGREMIGGGYAVSMCDRFPHPKCSDYDMMEKEARSTRSGMWSSCVR